MRSRELSSGARATYAALALLELLYGSLTLVGLLSPVYRLSGVVEGDVALSWYRLKFYGRPISEPFLDAVRLLALPAYALSVLAVVVSLASLTIARSRGVRAALSEAMLGVSLSAVMVVPLPIQLQRMVSEEVRGLRANFVFRTSAGLVNFGTTTVRVNDAARLMLSPHLQLPLVAATTALALAHYWLLLRTLRDSGTQPGLAGRRA